LKSLISPIAIGKTESIPFLVENEAHRKNNLCDERASSPVSPGLGELLVSWYYLGILCDIVGISMIINQANDLWQMAHDLEQYKKSR